LLVDISSFKEGGNQIWQCTNTETRCWAHHVVVVGGGVGVVGVGVVVVVVVVYSVDTSANKRNHTHFRY
jgi:hypothetical protein